MINIKYHTTYIKFKNYKIYRFTSICFCNLNNKICCCARAA